MPDNFNILDRAIAAPAFPVLPIRQVTNNRFFPTPVATGALNTLGNNTLRLAPFVLPNDLTLSHVGAEITVAGEAGSTFRIGIYETNAAGDYPGALLIQAAADLDGTSATVQEVACSVTLRGGRIYWVGGVVQGAPTTQPTIRVATPATAAGMVSGSVPSAQTAYLGYSQGSVSGALPATFSTFLSTAGAMPRVHFRLA